MKTVILYKLVHSKDGTRNGPFRSEDGYGNIFALEYNVGVETLPKIGKIFCFDTQKNACEYGEGILLKGIGTNPTKLKFLSGDKALIFKFWNQKIHKKRITVPTIKAVKGTILVDSFTPTEVVKYYERHIL